MNFTKLSSRNLIESEECNVEQRIDYYNIAPDAMQIMMEMEKYTKKNGIDRKLRELIKIRASQINGCAFCLNMHTADAKKWGRLNSVYFV